MRSATLRPVMQRLSFSLILLIIADSLLAYLNLQGTYATGELLDVIWPVSFLLLGEVVLALLKNGEKTQAEGAPLKNNIVSISFWRSLLPYAFMPAIGLLVWYTVVNGSGDASLEPGVYTGAVLLLLLVLFRQVLSLRETSRLNETLHLAHLEVQDKNLALAAANTQLEALATTDPLTGLANHRAFIQQIDKELERAHRYDQRSSLLFFDIDHFKALNDGYGHAVGDAVLREFGDVLQSLIRRIDSIGRWGGEEFVVLLPQMDAQEALRKAEQIRAAIAAHLFSVGSGMRLTCSLGVATFPTDAQDRDRLVEMADRAMYAAKRLGRNQVRIAGESAVLALESVTEQPGSREDAALLGTVEALSLLVEERDHSVGEHTQQVAELVTRLALAMGISASEARMLGLAGRLHDIGKVGISDAILLKPTHLTEQEWERVRQHPAIGASIVSHVPSLRTIVPLIRSHHERFDGRGYPDQLVGEEIPLGARILTVANAFTSMISERPYQEAHSQAWALAELRRGAGTQFDPQVVAVCETLFEAVEEENPLAA